jgi:hypothetical protein
MLDASQTCCILTLCGLLLLSAQTALYFWPFIFLFGGLGQFLSSMWSFVGQWLGWGVGFYFSLSSSLSPPYVTMSLSATFGILICIPSTHRMICWQQPAWCWYPLQILNRGVCAVFRHSAREGVLTAANVVTSGLLSNCLIHVTIILITRHAQLKATVLQRDQICKVTLGSRTQGLILVYTCSTRQPGDCDPRRMGHLLDRSGCGLRTDGWQGMLAWICRPDDKLAHACVHAVRCEPCHQSIVHCVLLNNLLVLDDQQQSSSNRGSIGS